MDQAYIINNFLSPTLSEILPINGYTRAEVKANKPYAPVRSYFQHSEAIECKKEIPYFQPS